MSRLYFHSQAETVEVLGAERSHVAILSEAIGYGVLEAVLGKALLAELVGYRPGESTRHLQLLVRNTEDPLYMYGGMPITAWPLLLNTALAVGSDAVKFATRVNAQCELFAWVAAKDRDWLSDIIDDGVHQGVLRREMGWEVLVEMLARGTGPVVMSYSVMDSFPNHLNSTWESSPDIGIDEASEQFDALSTEDQWEYGMDWLYRQEERMLQLKPENWSKVRLGHSFTAFDLEKIVRAERKADD
ncbi:hypothetical protein SEA_TROGGLEHUMPER_11 [Rhodococcus phage Trogglehumper]|uniref:Uncharacterized protein n=1 Tax=Rhodococcus phage Trogglehumper TaxID=3038381 RepID=A0AAF0K878_9CAUD|nr:hypothetical protein SEA_TROGGLEHUMPER_11 [Rhodococcus phage Trogglehumper]